MHIPPFLRVGGKLSSQEKGIKNWILLISSLNFFINNNLGNADKIAVFLDDNLEFPFYNSDQ